MRTFIWQYGKPQAMRGYNDDLVMALAVGCWVRDTALTVNKRDLEYRKAFFGAMTMKTTRFQHEQLGSSYSEKRNIEEKREDYFKDNKDLKFHSPRIAFRELQRSLLSKDEIGNFNILID